jgi:hypothetical protein
MPSASGSVNAVARAYLESSPFRYGAFLLP